MKNELDSHVLAIDKLGNAIDPDDGLHIQDLTSYFDDMFRHLEGVCEKQATKYDSDDVRRILIHIHGGLNTRQTTRKKAHKVSQLILSENKDSWSYPIFITWPSGGIGSYCEHLFFLRKGRRSDGPGIILFPAYLITDLLKGMARALVSFPYQLSNDFSALVYSWSGKSILPSWKNSNAIYGATINDDKIKYNVNLGAYDRTIVNKLRRLSWYLATLPCKLVMQVVVLDAAAEGAWNAMLHRIRNLFRKPEEFDIRRIRSNHSELSKWLETEPSGAIVVFWKQLEKFLETQAKNGNQYQVRLVGHSMGAIVLNQSVRYLPQKFVSSIVYMAPASTIRETSDSIIPMLQANNGTKFYLLVLHPVAEVEEVSLFDFVPRGSLLEWIDNWYTTPPSHTHRRLGKWVNAIQALHLFKDVREQVFFKGFEVKKNHIPLKHGDFNDCPFWREEFWEPRGPLSYPKSNGQ